MSEIPGPGPGEQETIDKPEESVSEVAPLIAEQEDLIEQEKRYAAELRAEMASMLEANPDAKTAPAYEELHGRLISIEIGVSSANDEIQRLREAEANGGDLEQPLKFH